MKKKLLNTIGISAAPDFESGVDSNVGSFSKEFNDRYLSALNATEGDYSHQASPIYQTAKHLILTNRLRVRDFEYYALLQSVKNGLSIDGIVGAVDKYVTFYRGEKFIVPGSKNDDMAIDMIETDTDWFVAWFLTKIGVIFTGNSEATRRPYLITTTSTPDVIASARSLANDDMLMMILKSEILCGMNEKYFAMNLAKGRIAPTMVIKSLHAIHDRYMRYSEEFSILELYVRTVSSIQAAISMNVLSMFKDKPEEFNPALNLKGVEYFGKYRNFWHLNDLHSRIAERKLLYGVDIRALQEFEDKYFERVKATLEDQTETVETTGSHSFNVTLFSQIPRIRNRWKEIRTASSRYCI